jgi:transcriptional regulator with XRE-family HTH domain
MATELLIKAVSGIRPTGADRVIGRNLRARRTKQKISQARLGRTFGTTSQQVEQYETGVSRMNASRLEAIARYLGVPVSNFFETSLENPISAKSVAAQSIGTKAQTQSATNECDLAAISLEEDTKILIYLFGKITRPKMKKNLFDLIVALGES